jgi:hypothetical protein
MRPLSRLLVGLTLLSCGGSPAAPAPSASSTANERAPLVGRDVAARLVRPTVRPGERVLDVDASRTLVARPMSVPDHADPPFRAMVALWESGAEARRVAWHYDDVFIAHAALLPGGGLAVIDAEGRLLVLDAPDATPRLVAEGASGPIGVSPDGGRITFVHGEMPDFELHEIAHSGGPSRAVTKGLAPVWCAAPGREPGSAVFASGAGGDAGTWLLSPGAPPRRVAGLAFPSGLIAPDAVALGDRDLYVYETEADIAVVDALGTLVEMVPAGRAPFLHHDGTLEYLTSGGWQSKALAGRRVAP